MIGDVMPVDYNHSEVVDDIQSLWMIVISTALMTPSRSTSPTPHSWSYACPHMTITTFARSLTIYTVPS